MLQLLIALAAKWPVTVYLFANLFRYSETRYMFASLFARHLVSVNFGP